MARNNVQTTVTVGMDVQLAKRNAEALKQVIIDLKAQLKDAKAIMDSASTAKAFKDASAAVDELILKIKTLEKVQRSATPAAAYESFISGDVMNSNTLRQAQRGAKNRLNTVNEFAGDKEARKFINDIDKTQMRLNRLQAGFTKPLQSVKKELNDLSGGELQRLLTLLQQEQKLVQGNDKAWASYSVAIGKVEERMREYDTVARQTMGEQTLKQSKRGGFAQANERDLQRAIEKLREYRTVISDPNGAGKATWEATTREILKLQTTLDTLKQKTAEMKGEAMSAAKAEQIGMQALKGTYTGDTKQLALAKKTLEERLLLVRRGTDEYKRLQKAIQGCEQEEKRMGMTAKEIQAVLDKPKGKSYNELKIAVEQGRMELSRMRTETDADKKKFDELAAKVKACDIQMKQLAGSAKGSASAFDKAWSRLKTYIGLYVGAAVAMQKLTATLGDIMELSDKMGEVRKTTGFTADEVGRLSDNLKKFDTRTTLTGLMDLSVAAGQLGLKTEEDVLGFTEAANKLMVALPEMGKEGATEMLKVALATGEIDKIRKQMEQGLIDGSSATAVAMEKVGSTIDRLRATSAATAPAITDFVKRVGAVGAQSGISIDQVAALGSTVDALGMRVEMSATALSRMIPAIKNNAFDIAKAIGVTPDTLRNLFETGRGMEAILMIFQHIKDSGMDEDSVESMLGMGNMKEIMKELNQQGARAGIVFAGLSQNVDELRRQLGVAANAYEENIAIQQEYDKMNETTAAKWERLKNQLEEMFVGDSMQKFLGVVIEGLRKIVDLLAGNGGASIALKMILVYLALVKMQLVSLASGALKAVGGGLKNIGIMLGFIKGEMTAMQWGNIFTAALGALSLLVFKVAEWRKETMEALREQGKFAAEILKSEQAVEKNFKAVDKANGSVEEANKKLKEAQEALDKAKKTMDGSRESAEKLTKAEDNLKKAEDDVKMANDAHRSSIEQINKLYGNYLGFMLSEISSADELANARELINAKLRETITLKRREAALGRIEEKMGEGRDTAYGELSQSLGGAVRKQVTVGRTKDKYGKIIEQKAWQTDEKATQELLREITKVAQDEALSRTEAAARIDKLLIDAGKGGEQWKAWRSNIQKNALAYQKEYKDVQTKVHEVERQFDVEMQIDREESQEKLGKQYKEADKNYANLEKEHAEAQGDAKKQTAANLLKQMDSMEEMIGSAKNFYDLTNDSEKESYDNFVASTKARLDGMKDQRDALLKEAGSLYKSRKTISGGRTTGGSGDSPWGNRPDATSTDYGTWDVDELVARRNQMDKFKNVLKPGIDVKQVLAEDKALMKAITNKEITADWKDVLNWYNKERLKIQDELKSERFSTNQGHWRDEKSGKKKNIFAESDYALAELDRYYSRRKEALEKARVEENMSEELFNRQAELLEQEHLERRSKLRGTFTGELGKEETEQFRQWWDALEKQLELDHVKWSTVASEWAKANAGQIGRNNLKMQQDMTQMESITVKHLNAIAKIIEKERPYDGITANLRKNLTDMDILLADVQKNGPAKDTAQLMQEQTKRLQFLLGEAETAYKSSIDDVLRRMGEQGMTAWAEEISKSDAMKNALMAQLQTAYDAIQDAIKKEASQIKKQTDIWWNDLESGKTTSRKGGFESMLSRLGLQGDQVKRANSLIGAGQASERVADKLAIKQMQIRLQMQDTYYKKMRQMWADRIASLRAQGKEIDAQHAEISKQLSLSEEQKKLDEQRVAIANQLEESQNRLYKELREWGDLLTSGLQGVMEASNAGQGEYYNSLAKMRLTGEGAGGGAYIVTENAGSSDAEAHYEYLDGEAALRRQMEIEQQNAQADAWKKLFDDFNQKMSDTITDQMNAMLQNASIDLNTDATLKNTEAMVGLTQAMANASTSKQDTTPSESRIDYANNLMAGYPIGGDLSPAAQQAINESNLVTDTVVKNEKKKADATEDSNNEIQQGTKSAFAKMTQAANLYGAAYQAMSNDNLDMTQKFEMIALQAAGNAAIAGLTVAQSQGAATAAASMPGAAARASAEEGPIAGPILFAILSALVGGLIGLAASKIAKSKSQISQVTGASVGAGRLATGMFTYAEGNVNEFTDPSTLTVGRQYNVDAADGRTYRARYMGSNPKTHLTNGPEFHLSGERGREMIIDAGTTRQITMNEAGIWKTIQTLSGGGRLTARRRSGRGMRAFAEGNVEEFEEMGDMGSAGDMNGMASEQMMQMQQSLDRNSAVLEKALREGFRGVFNVYGKGGLVDSYDQGKQTVKRHGERY